MKKFYLATTSNAYSVLRANAIQALTFWVKKVRRTMNFQKLIQGTFRVMVISFLLSGYGRINALPRSGDWRVTTDFGEFVFTVNPAGTQITKIIFTFVNFTCGPIRTSGGITITSQWPITNNQFAITNSWSSQPLVTMTINGTFTQAGDQASGTWSENVAGTICPGSWGPVLVSIEELSDGISDGFMLAQNYPNPFNLSTKILFAVPSPGPISIKVYNTFGKEVATLLDTHITPGQYSITWNATNFANGVYVYRMHAGDFVETKELILIK
jgi:hypothetical protein